MAAENKKEDKDMELEYEALRKKHGLPQLKELDRDFSIGSLEQGNFVLRNIIVRMADRCDFALKILNSMIQPESRIADMQEAESLGPSEREAVLRLFRRLSYFEKEFVILEFGYDEEKAAAAIRKFYDEWQSHKVEFIAILKAMQSTWNGSGPSKGSYSYFG